MSSISIHSQTRRFPSLAGFPLLFVVLIATAVSSRALYIQPDLVDVPVGRLIANIEAASKKKPKDAALQHHLARAHAVAYARNLDSDGKVKQQKGKDANAIWFGFNPPHVPYASPQRAPKRGKKEKPNPERTKVAREHLKSAVAAYERALKLGPKNAQTIRLGLGWCRKEAGDSKKAAADFRAVIAEAWKKEGSAKFGGMREFVAVEAIGYLLPLLDEKKDAKEIADLAAKKKKLQALPRPVTPIAVPLRDGIGAREMIHRELAVAFDLDASGFTDRRWQWIDPANAAWLVHDPRGTGEIRSGLQMFGSRSFTLFFEHGYEALALLDDNADGELRGGELRGLALWRDANANGKSEKGEVLSVGEYGIEALSCRSSLNAEGVRASAGGVTYRDGTQRDTFDLVLKSR